MSDKKDKNEIPRKHDEALVPIGHDYRGKENQIKNADTTAPDGIAGDWS